MKKLLFACLLLASAGWLAAPTTAEETGMFLSEASRTEVAPTACAEPGLFAPPAEERIPPLTPQWCGDPCPIAGEESFCTGYSCRTGALARRDCYCQQSSWGLRWTCGWAC